MSFPDTRVFATVFYSDRSIQYICTVVVSILALPLNILTVYLILFQSKKERRAFKFSLACTQMMGYLSQFHMGVLAGLGTLHPFPAMYSQGILSPHVSTYSLCMIWVLLFCAFVYNSFVVLLIRLRMVARPRQMFDRPTSSYAIVYVILALYVFVPVPSILAFSYSSQEEMKEAVLVNFPNNMQVFDNPGVFVFANKKAMVTGKIVLPLMIFTGFLVVLAFYVCISRETRINNPSCRYIAENLKSLRNFLIQGVCVAIFISISCGLLLVSFLYDPSVDSRISNTICYTCVCGFSIPHQTLIIYRNKAYRTFVSRNLFSRSSVSLSHHRLSILS